jgi:Zn-finger protein
MKAIIKKVTSPTADNKAVVNLEIEIKKDDGSLLWSGQRAIATHETDPAKVQAYIKTSLQNIRNQAVAEANAKLKDVVDTLVNQEIDLDK